MRVKLFAALLLIMAVTIGISSTRNIRKERTSSNIAETSFKPSTNTAQRPSDPPGTIDGSKNPEMVPDSTAYILFFRVLAGRHTEDEKIKIQYYLRQDQPDFPDADINALLIAAEEFHALVSVLDKQAKEIKDLY